MWHSSLAKKNWFGSSWQKKKKEKKKKKLCPCNDKGRNDFFLLILSIGYYLIIDSVGLKFHSTINIFSYILIDLFLGACFKHLFFRNVTFLNSPFLQLLLYSRFKQCYNYIKGFNTLNWRSINISKHLFTVSLYSIILLPCKSIFG